MLPVIRSRNLLPDFVDDFFGREFPGFFTPLERSMSTPAVNILENKDEYRIEVAAPGLDKKDFKIDLENEVLTISAEKEEKHEEGDDKYMRKEFSFTQFSRSFILPDTAAADRISAQQKDGILTVVIPKREEAKKKPPRQINIS